jgi:hypothetical protein
MVGGKLPRVPSNTSPPKHTHSASVQPAGILEANWGEVEALNSNLPLPLLKIVHLKSHYQAAAKSILRSLWSLGFVLVFCLASFGRTTTRS